jgi:hypothetical protein
MSILEKKGGGNEHFDWALALYRGEVTATPYADVCNAIC